MVCACSGKIRSFFQSEIIFIALAISSLLSAPDKLSRCIKSIKIRLQSSASNIEKLFFNGVCLSSKRNKFKPKVWNVETESPFPSSLPKSLLTRSFISRAALLVNVIAVIRCAGIRHCFTKYAIFCVITEVLPEPAPASTNNGP